MELSDILILLWFLAGALGLMDLCPSWELVLGLFGTILLPDVRVVNHVIGVSDGELDHAGASLSPDEGVGAVSAVASLSSIVKLDAVVVTPEVVVVIMSAEHGLDVAHLLECGIEASVNCLAANSLILLAINGVEVPQILILRKRNVEEGETWEWFTVLFDELLAYLLVPSHLTWVDASPSMNALAIVTHRVECPQVEELLRLGLIVDRLHIVC